MENKIPAIIADHDVNTPRTTSCNSGLPSCWEEKVDTQALCGGVGLGGGGTQGTGSSKRGNQQGTGQHTVSVKKVASFKGSHLSQTMS